MCFLFLFFFLRADTTRISFTIPLRESFGFPFLFAQIACINYFLKKDVSSLAQVATFTFIVFPNKKSLFKGVLCKITEHDKRYSACILVLYSEYSLAVAHGTVIIILLI